MSILHQSPPLPPQHQVQEPFHITDLQAFIAECTDTANSGKFGGVETSPCSIFCCCDR